MKIVCSTEVFELLLVDLPISDSRVLVVGGGSIAERKARKLIQEHPHILVASKEFTSGLLDLKRRRKVELVKMDAAANHEMLDKMIAKSDIAIIATSDIKTNGEIAMRARSRDVLVNAVDNPSESDFNFPASRKVGDICVAVSTGGKSPTMARVLCKRLSKEISREDIRQVRLQAHARKLASHLLPDSDSRKKALYAILRDTEIQDFLRRGRFAEAKISAKRIIVQESRKQPQR